MAQHLLTSVRDWWDQYSLPIILLFTSLLLLSHRVEMSSNADVSIISGFYGPGAVMAWLITAFSMLCSGSGQILFSKLQTFTSALNDNIPDVRQLKEFGQLSLPEQAKIYDNIWPPERHRLSLWDSEAVAVASYAVIAYLHMTSKWWSKNDPVGMLFSCSSQAVAAHNVLLPILY
jgi:hypothetical protein